MFSWKILTSSFLCLSLFGCASNPKLNTGLGSVSDATTTYLALNSGDFTEGNPVLSWVSDNPFSVAVTAIVAKQTIKYALASVYGEDELINKTIESASFGAAAWNLSLMMGSFSNVAGATAAVAAAYGYWVWDPDGDSKPFFGEKRVYAGDVQYGLIKSKHRVQVPYRVPSI